MILVKTSCPGCGEITLQLPQIHLHVSQSDATSFFSYVCPTCGRMAGGRADSRFVYLLMSNGIKPEMGTFPVEVFEPKEGKAFTWDDVLEFHEELEQEDWFQHVLKNTH